MGHTFSKVFENKTLVKMILVRFEFLVDILKYFELKKVFDPS